MKRTATLLALTGLALSSNVDRLALSNEIDQTTTQDDEQFIPLLVRAGVWALGHPQQITKGVEVGVKAIPAVIGGTKKVVDWIQHHDDEDEFFVQDDEFFAQDDEFFVEGDDELFVDDEFYAQEDNEYFAPIVARAGVWALTHPQQITKGVEVGIKAAPAVIGGAKKAIDWIKHHDDDELFAQEDDEYFAPIVARAGVWALTHPQQITKGVEVGIKAAPAVIGGAKKAINWIKHHDDDELFAQEDDELFVEKHTEVKPKKNGQKLRRGHHFETEKSDLAQLGDLLRESHKL